MPASLTWLDIRQIAHDRRMAAVHEAGHVVVARHLGLEAHGRIWRAEHPEPGCCHWAGQTEWYATRGCLTTADARLIAVAGFAAELVWRGRGDADAEDILMMLMLPDAMSPTDWTLAGIEPGEPTDELAAVVEQVITLIGKGGPLWTMLVEERRKIIEQGPLESRQI